MGCLALEERSRDVTTTRLRVAGSIAIGGVLAISWWELLFLPLGASHDGRINGRFGLHVRNFLESGLRGSDFLASMEPFSNVPYTHHPPLLNLLHTTVGSVLGQGEWQLHLIGYVAGLGTVAGLMWLARELELGAAASVASLALVAATPMFWIYARLGLGVSLIVAFLALWQRHRRLGDHHRTLPPAAGITAFGSWMGVLLIILLALRGLRDPHFRGMAIRIGIAGLGAAIVALVWALGAGQVTELVDHVGTRLHWPAWSELVSTYGWFYQTLFPGWFLWGILPALAVSVADRATRSASVAVIAALGVWTLITPGAALVHDYWTYPLLVPVFLGLAVGLDRIGAFLKDGRLALGVYVVLSALAVAGFARLPDYRDAYFRAPSAAGALLKEVAPPFGQVTAWVLEGVDPLPRWVSYYWDLPTAEVNGGNIDQVGDGDLVLIRLDQAPEWTPTQLQPVARQGRYAFVTRHDLRSNRQP